MSAFLLWGSAPIYVKLLKLVPVAEIVMHRVVWSFLLLLLLLICQGRIKQLAHVITNRRVWPMLCLSTAALGLNWFIVNWAIIHEHVLQISLGYYISPILSVLLGALMLKEPQSRPQMIAVVLALCGVVYLSRHGSHLWIALTIACLFVIYTLAHKAMTVLPLPGLCIETFLLSIPALFGLVYLEGSGAGSFLRMGAKTDLLLAGTPLITALPLLFLTLGAKRLPLSLMGILQYIMPSCGFILAVFLFREPFDYDQLLAFILIWIGLVVYSTDTVKSYQRSVAEAEDTP